MTHTRFQLSGTATRVRVVAVATVFSPSQSTRHTQVITKMVAKTPVPLNTMRATSIAKVASVASVSVKALQILSLSGLSTMSLSWLRMKPMVMIT